jgi:hypothetical protein
MKRRGNYVSNACTHCRAKKIKCDADPTCKNCVKKGVVCIRKSPSRRGPQPRDIEPIKKIKNAKQGHSVIPSIQSQVEFEKQASD